LPQRARCARWPTSFWCRTIQDVTSANDAGEIAGTIAIRPRRWVGHTNNAMSSAIRPARPAGSGSVVSVGATPDRCAAGFRPTSGAVLAAFATMRPSGVAAWDFAADLPRPGALAGTAHRAQMEIPPHGDPKRHFRWRSPPRRRNAVNLSTLRLAGSGADCRQTVAGIRTWLVRGHQSVGKPGSGGRIRTYDHSVNRQENAHNETSRQITLKPVSGDQGLHIPIFPATCHNAT
jgi:hypothetical protein